MSCGTFRTCNIAYSEGKDNTYTVPTKWGASFHETPVNKGANLKLKAGYVPAPYVKKSLVFHGANLGDVAAGRVRRLPCARAVGRSLNSETFAQRRLCVIE